MKVWYLPLEPYRERYTEQLLDWTLRAFRRNGVDCEVVQGTRLDGHERIRTGPVLDAEGRSHYALTQMARLVACLHEVGPEDWIFLEDLFTPGYEALPYVLQQRRDRACPRIATRNYAQSVDPDDFTFGMRPWMRRFEQLVDRTCDAVFVASTEHKVLWQVAGLGSARTVHVAGLPFDKDAVREQGPETVRPWEDRERLVVYASRLDREKQPHLFMDAVERMAGRCRFVVCTGADTVRSNDPTVAPRLAILAAAGKVDLWTGLTKARYYDVLSRARVQLNTARQDWVSFTALEASAFGVPTLAPGFRGFPEALENRGAQLYTPWVLDDLVLKLEALLDSGEPACWRLADHHHHTLDRMIEVFRA